jgi:hypothetical protein
MTVIDYLGSTRKTHIVRRTKRAIRPIKTINCFCKKTKFDVYPKQKMSCTTSIPHMNTVSGSQVVIGRIKTLERYKYDKCHLFEALTLPYEHEAKAGNLFWTIKINDIFMYCAQRRRQRFPIRLVVDPKPRGTLNRLTADTVTWREEQQLLRYFKMYKYKSLTHKGIFFFSKYPRLRSPGICRTL